MQYNDFTDPQADNEETQNEITEWLNSPEGSMHNIRRGETIQGVVIRLDADEALVDIGGKSEAVLPVREMFDSGLGSKESLKVGDTVFVNIIRPDFGDGRIIVSIRKAQAEYTWLEMQTHLANNDILDGKIIDVNRGGAIVMVKGLRGFIPLSHINSAHVKPNSKAEEIVAALQQLVNKTIKVKILEVNHNQHRIVFSERAAIQNTIKAFFDTTQPGDILQGTVARFAAFGVFVNLGFIDGLVHISEIGWSRVSDPSEIVSIGQKVSVRVKTIDPESKRISLSLKDTSQDPWETIEEKISVGEIYEGKVIFLAPFGAFVRLIDGIEGLIHISEIYPPVQDIHMGVKLQDTVKVKVIAVDKETRRIGLSMKQVLAPDVAVPADSSSTESATPSDDVSSQTEVAQDSLPIACDTETNQSDAAPANFESAMVLQAAAAEPSVNLQ